MSELRAEPLSPIDTATLWPQLHHLATEVIATRGGENLLVSSGLAATGLTRLPRMPRTIVLGLKRLGYDRVRFLKPVFINDTITVRYTVDSIDAAKNRTVAKVEVTTERGELAAVASHIMVWLPRSTA